MGGIGVASKPMPVAHRITIPGVQVPAPNITVNSSVTTVPMANAIFDGPVSVGGNTGGTPATNGNTNGSTNGATGIAGTSGTTGTTGNTVLRSGIVSQAPAEVIVRANTFIPFGAPAVAPSTISDFVVGGVYETQTVTEDQAFTETTCVDRPRVAVVERPVQAVCLDDTGTPHPASRLSPDDTVAASYNGEVFRCMAGTSMQVTLGSYTDGEADFAQAQTFSCEKGEALTYGPGGTLECARQAPARNCNERSLLRRYGPGMKRVAVSTPETYCEPTTRTVFRPVTREVQVEAQLAPTTLQLNGGVGQGVN